MGWQPVFEPHAENPFLADFYKDMSRWGFPSQVFFLSQRLQEHHRLLQIQDSVIQDRSVYEDAEIFARNLFVEGHMTQREWSTYSLLYDTLKHMLRQPNLVVYLRAKVNTLINRISLRGRDYERSISSEYLQQLNRLYEDWISGFDLCPVLTIETDNLDYVQKPRHLELVIHRIQDRLLGKERIDIT